MSKRNEVPVFNLCKNESNGVFYPNTPYRLTPPLRKLYLVEIVLVIQKY